MVTALAAGLKKAGSTDTEKLITAFEGLEFPSPFGKATFRAIDHQSTMGVFVGKTADQGRQGGDGRTIAMRTAPSSSRPDSVVKTLRPDAP